MKLSMAVVAAACALVACGGSGDSRSSPERLTDNLDAQAAQVAKKVALKQVNCSEMDSEGCGAGTEENTPSLYGTYGNEIICTGGSCAGSWGAEPGNMCSDMECPSCVCNGPAPTRSGMFSAHKCVQAWTYGNGTGMGTYTTAPTGTGTMCWGRTPTAWVMFVPTANQTAMTAPGTYQ